MTYGETKAKLFRYLRPSAHHYLNQLNDCRDGTSIDHQTSKPVPCMRHRVY